MTIRASLTDRAHRRWTSSATYRADDEGRIDLDRTAPGKDPSGKLTPDSMRPFWTMATKGDARVWPDLADRNSVTLTVSDHSVELARRTVVRRSTVPGLQQRTLTVARDGMVGVYYQPPHTDRPKPAVLMLGGSEGGLQPTLLAKMLAVHGYPTLRLAYFDAPGLPRYLDKIPVEYAGKALRYLARQPGVDPHRVVVLGASRGGELAELLGVHYPDLVHGVVALTAANVAIVGLHGKSSAWTWHGRQVPFTQQFNNPAPTDDPDAVIPVERIAGPVLVACGGLDQFIESCEYAPAIMQRLKSHHHSYPDRMLQYPDAGHFVNGVLPYVPLGKDPFPEGDEKARVAEYPVILHWLASLPAGKN